MPFLDRRLIRSFDWISFFVTLALAACGLLFIFSATYKPDAHYSLFFKKQAMGVITGLCIYFACCAIDYRTLMRWAYFGYLGIICLLIFTLIKGSIGMGGQRWIDMGLFKIQPSELAKLFFPAFAVYYLYTQDEGQPLTFRDFIPILAILAVSFVLIAKQPDLGTALIVVISSIMLLWLAGIPKLFFVVSIVLGLICAPLLWQVLKPYQKQRIFVFLGEGNVKKERYQIEQSKIAIGSGGITGKGFLQGTQNKLNFLPESRTDFIFSVVAEEIGFMGTLCIIALYILLFCRFFIIIASIKAHYVQLLAIGIVLPIIISTLINMGMVIGLLPIVGIPLPLISYGVSNLWVIFATLGWFNGIAMRRFDINKC
jgi:rod shape determining protein RodA